MTPILDVTNDITARALSHPEVFADAVERLDKGKPSILYHKAQMEGSSWSRWTDYGSGVVNYIREFVSVLVQPQIGFLQDTGLAVCCVGCNDGLELEEWHRQGYEPVGFDLHPERVDVARKCGLAVQVGDIHAPPFDPETFDIVFCSHTLEHARDRAVACKALAGLVKPQGLLLIVVPLEVPGFPRTNPAHTASVKHPDDILQHFTGWGGLEPRIVKNHHGDPELYLVLKKLQLPPQETDDATLVETAEAPLEEHPASNPPSPEAGVDPGDQGPE